MLVSSTEVFPQFFSLSSSTQKRFTGKCKNKNFYTFIKHKRTDSSGVAPLKSNGSTFTDPTQQATVLNQQFESVFSRPKTLRVKFFAELWFHGLKPKNVIGMPEITITINGVEGLLKGP